MSRMVRVLVCDDHAAYRDCITSSLRNAGSTIDVVGEAADGLEAVERTLDINPDVVLMDLEMPRLDGIEATRRIKKAAKHIKVLFLSMYDDEQIAGRCLEAGASGYVLKGITCVQLADAILAVDNGGFLTGTQALNSA
jgi:DNA-binding NarL/FixJ family response regulator